MEETSVHSVTEADLQKSYGKLLEQREALLSREARCERQVQHLNRVFQDQQDELQRIKAERVKENAKKNFEKLQQKKLLHMEAEERLKDTVRTERKEVNNLIQEKWRRQQVEEEEAKQEEEQRRFLIQARNVYDKLRSEERRILLEEKRVRTNTELRARLEKDEADHREARERAHKDASMAGDKLRAKVEKARERRIQKHMDDKKSKIAGFTDLEEAHARAQESRQQDMLAIRKQREEAAQQRAMRLKDAEEKMAAKQDLKRNKLFEKMRQVHERHEILLARKEEALTSARRQRDARLEAIQAQKEERQKQAELSSRSWHTPRQIPGPKLDVVHKDYIARQAELEKTQEKMWTRKRYRDVEELSNHKAENLQMLRLQAVHKSYASRRGTSEPGSRSMDSTIRQGSDGEDSRYSRGFPSPRRTGQKLRECAMCERMFPIEALPGKALRQAIEKVKSKDGPPRRVSATWSSPRDMLATDRSSNSGRPRMNSARQTAERQLYDHDMPLCLTCYHYLHVVLM